MERWEPCSKDTFSLQELSWRLWSAQESRDGDEGAGSGERGLVFHGWCTHSLLGPCVCMTYCLSIIYHLPFCRLSIIYLYIHICNSLVKGHQEPDVLRAVFLVFLRWEASRRRGQWRVVGGVVTGLEPVLGLGMSSEFSDWYFKNVEAILWSGFIVSYRDTRGTERLKFYLGRKQQMLVSTRKGPHLVPLWCFNLFVLSLLFSLWPEVARQWPRLSCSMVVTHKSLLMLGSVKWLTLRRRATAPGGAEPAPGFIYICGCDYIASSGITLNVERS